MRYKLTIDATDRPLVYDVTCTSGYLDDGTEKLFHTEMGAEVRYDYRTRTFKTLGGWLIGTASYDWSEGDGPIYDYLWEHYNPGISEQIIEKIENDFAEDIKKAKESCNVQRFLRTISLTIF